MHTSFVKMVAATIAVLGMIVFVITSVRASPEQNPPAAVAAAPIAAPVINYQGRLVDPATNAPISDGSYTMAFALYTAETGGTPVWTESKDVNVSNGLFSTLLGDTTPLNAADFNSQGLWLGIQVGSDPEMTPRQRIGYAAYAMHALDADTLDGQQSSDFAAADHTHDEFNLLPIAMGFVLDFSGKDAPEIERGTGNFTVEYDTAQGRYEIEIADESYFFRQYITLITATDENVTVSEGSVGGKLLVEIRNSSGNPVRGSFQFVVYQP